MNFVSIRATCPPLIGRLQGIHGILRLLERRYKRVYGEMIDDRVHQPSNGYGDIACEGDCFQLEVYSTIPFLVPCNTVHPPDVAVAGSRGQKALSGASIVLDLLHLKAIRDLVSATRVYSDMMRLVLTFDCGSDKEDFVLPAYPEPLIVGCADHDSRVDHDRFVEILVCAVILQNDGKALDRGSRYEYTADPMMDEAIGHPLGSV